MKLRANGPNSRQGKITPLNKSDSPIGITFMGVSPTEVSIYCLIFKLAFAKQLG